MANASSTSLIPPRLLAKLEKLPYDERRMYAQEVIGGYERGILALKHRAEEIAEEWVKAQANHLQAVVDELRDLADL